RHTRSKRDWSSDVCSSDLGSTLAAGGAGPARPESLTAHSRAPYAHLPGRIVLWEAATGRQVGAMSSPHRIESVVYSHDGKLLAKIGRASCRERVYGTERAV